MKRYFSCAIVSLVLAQILPLHARAATTGQERLLFRWNFPARGHHGAWSFHQGMASYTGEANETLLSPYIVPRTGAFALQAEMRGTGPGGPEASLSGFGLVVRQKAGDPHSSIAGGSFFSSNPEDNNPELYWNGATVGGAAFTSGSAWHLYRLEVRGTLYRLLIDGRLMVEYVITDHPGPTRAGFFSTYRKVAVRGVVFYALNASGAAPVPYPDVKSLNLTVGDLPDTSFYLPDLLHFYTDTEVARERQVSQASVEASGRLTGYGIDFFPRDPTLVDLFSTVVVFTTPDKAKADVPDRLTALRRSFSGQLNYHELPLNQIGDASGGLSLDLTLGGSTFTVGLLYFARGPYTELLRITVLTSAWTPDRVNAELLNLGKIVDQRLQARGRRP